MSSPWLQSWVQRSSLPVASLNNSGCLHTEKRGRKVICLLSGAPCGSGLRRCCNSLSFIPTSQNKNNCILWFFFFFSLNFNFSLQYFFFVPLNSFLLMYKMCLWPFLGPLAFLCFPENGTSKFPYTYRERIGKWGCGRGKERREYQ